MPPVNYVDGRGNLGRMLVLMSGVLLSYVFETVYDSMSPIAMGDWMVVCRLADEESTVDARPLGCSLTDSTNGASHESLEHDYDLFHVKRFSMHLVLERAEFALRESLRSLCPAEHFLAPERLGVKARQGIPMGMHGVWRGTSISKDSIAVFEPLDPADGHGRE